MPFCVCIRATLSISVLLPSSITHYSKMEREEKNDAQCCLESRLLFTLHVMELDTLTY